MANGRFRKTAEAGDEGLRIDAWLSEAEGTLSRSYIQKLIRAEAVQVNGRSIRSSYRLQAGDLVEVDLPEAAEPDILPENIPLSILYEDDSLLVVDKPKGMVVHPAAGHESGTLVNALLYHCGDSLSGINGVLRPGIVHRIDKDTTGLLAVCKTDTAHRALAEQLQVHSITRRYRAILHGSFRGSASDFHIVPREKSLLDCQWESERTSLAGSTAAQPVFRVEGCIGRHAEDRKKMTITDPAHGRPAVTHVRLLSAAGEWSYVECALETGRTHQIRVHTSHIGHPILGDPVYGPKHCPVSGLEGQTLHAMTLGFRHPETGEYMEFSSKLPDYFSELLKKFGLSRENML